MEYIQLRRGQILFNMTKNQKTVIVFFFEGNGLVVSTPKQPQGVSFQFPTGSVEHMEIINYDAVHDLISQACATLELTDVLGLVVFGKTLFFEKQFQPLPEDKLETETEQFRNSTPFERVATHVYKTSQGPLLISMNRDFYDTLRQILERAGVHVVGVIPSFVLTGLIGSKPISVQSLTLLASKLEELANESIIVHKVVPKTLQEKQEYISKKYSGLVVVVFVLFLIAVFGVTGYILQSQFTASRKPSPTPATLSVPVSITPLPVPTDTPEPVASTSAIKISISYVPEVASLSAKLKEKLKGEGYIQVTSQSQAGLQGNKPLLVFKSTLSATNRAEIQSVVEELFPSLSVQELSELPSDVSLTIGK